MVLCVCMCVFIVNYLSGDDIEGKIGLDINQQEITVGILY